MILQPRSATCPHPTCIATSISPVSHQREIITDTQTSNLQVRDTTVHIHSTSSWLDLTVGLDRSVVGRADIYCGGELQFGRIGSEPLQSNSLKHGPGRRDHGGRHGGQTQGAIHQTQCPAEKRGGQSQAHAAPD